MKKVWLIFFIIWLLTACSAQKDLSEPTDPATNNSNGSSDEKAVKIGDTVFNKKEMQFYALMQKVYVEKKRERELTTAKPSDEQDINDYWEKQLAQLEQPNVQLQSVIEIHSMAMLGKEKSYYVPEEDVDEEMTTIQKWADNNPRIASLLKEWEEDALPTDMRLYLRERLLRDRVIEELQRTVRAEQPDANDQIILYETETAYEDLYEDQVSQLDLEIYLR